MAGALLSPSEENALANRGHRILKKLGEGSYAQVYLLDHNKNDGTNQKIQLACKLIDASKAPKDFVRKFLPRELDILVRLNHPHIIHVHSIFQKKQKYFIVMRFAESGDLLEYVLAHGELSEERSRFWCRQMALALQYLHEMGIAHRDLKCENILITELMNIKLADFGFARFVTDEDGRSTNEHLNGHRSTPPGRLRVRHFIENRASVLSSTYCGSLTYAAPEVLRGLPYEPKVSDMWSLGVILYVMLNKSMPFDDANMKKMYERQMNKRMRFRTKVVDKLSNEVKTTTLSMLEPVITKRLRINELIGGEWFAMDPKIKIMSPMEKQALEQARAAFQSLLANNRKSREGIMQRPGSRMPTQSTVQDAIHADAAGLSQLNVIMHTKPPLYEASKMDTTYNANK